MNEQLGLGVLGWGTAGQLMAAAVSRSALVQIVGVADSSAGQRDDAERRTGAPTYACLEDMLESSDVEAVYIATPTPLHSRQVMAAANAGKHVVVEKPMAMSLSAALADCRTAEAAGVQLLVGCTHSYNAPVAALRRFARAGHLGALTALRSTCATDWLRRPRTAADLDAGLGGGLIHRQGAHQFDIVRYVAPGTANTLYATTIGGRAGTETGFSAFISFDDDVTALTDYSGSGGFDTRLLTHGVGELGETIDPPEVLRRHFVTACGEAPVAPMFGSLRATFDAGEVITTPRGLLVFEGKGAHEVPLPPDAKSGWDALLDELRAAVAGEAVVHTGRWSIGTLDMCHAVHQSATRRTPVALVHQSSPRTQPALSGKQSSRTPQETS